MCSFCVVPFTRGRERSRPSASVVQEAQNLYEAGYKEVTLLGQNVDSYNEQNEAGESICNFAGLLKKVAAIAPDLRVRFSSSHPKDITDEVLFAMQSHPNICKHIHFPIQSGNSRVLNLMNRTYDREWLIQRIQRIRELMPHCGISTDIIAGFCSETEVEHQETVSMMRDMQFNFAFMYAYSEREGTLAQRRYADDIPAEVKSRRLAEIISTQQKNSVQLNQNEIGQIHTVLAEGFSKRSDQDLRGRNEQNIIVIFPKENYQKGDYVRVKIESSSQTTLVGKAIEKIQQPNSN
jgi:tRNA-2-methylthio-N6-dimethylallyladenosine synthase